MTANSMEGDREECLEAGMNDYIGKPVTAAKLRGVIKRWFLVALDSEPVPEESVEAATTESTRETDKLTITVRVQPVDTARGSSRQTIWVSTRSILRFWNGCSASALATATAMAMAKPAPATEFR